MTKCEELSSWMKEFERTHGRKPAVAVDFDGCLCTNSYPSIGAANVELIETLKGSNARLILWTCRSGKELQEAVDFCRNHGLSFAAVNDNLPELQEIWGSDPRKVGADAYLDDKAWSVIADA